MATTLLLASLFTLTTTANALPQQNRTTSHLSKRYIYYRSSILVPVLALCFFIFWFAGCFWYIRHRRRVGRPATSIEAIFMWRYFPRMGQAQPQIVVPQPTVVVVNNNGPPSSNPYMQQGIYQYGHLPGQDMYPQNESYINPGPYETGPYEPAGPFQRTGNWYMDGRGGPASPAPAYMGK